MYEITTINKIRQTMSSREISELTGKRHDHVLRDCDVLNENYEKMGFPKIGEGYYTHPNTGNQQHREYRLTKMQTFDLLTGYSAELRIKVNSVLRVYNHYYSNISLICLPLSLASVIIWRAIVQIAS